MSRETLKVSQWEAAAAPPCPWCGQESFRSLELPLGGNGCRSCAATEERWCSRIPQQMANAVRGMRSGELHLMVTHMRDTCPNGHDAVHRYDPNGAGYTLVCLSCSTQGTQMFEGACQTCGAPCWSIYSKGRNNVIWKLRCANGHTKARTL